MDKIFVFKSLFTLYLSQQAAVNSIWQRIGRGGNINLTLEQAADGSGQYLLCTSTLDHWIGNTNWKLKLEKYMQNRTWKGNINLTLEWAADGSGQHLFTS